jgi:hypothetical protein
MLGGCIISANYSMQATIYEKVRTLTYSGQINDCWSISNYGNNGIIDCNIATFASASFRLQAMTEIFGDRYKDLQFLKMSCGLLLPHTVRITNIVSKIDGAHLFTEPELAGNPDTWFNANGSSPIIDPFGKIEEYEITIHRAEVQSKQC